MRDLVVAGGGPVGLAAALHAERAGLDVVVHEPRDGTIDKACGEGLMPAAVAGLEELGVRPGGHTITGIRYLDGRTTAEAPFRRGDGRGVRRTVLHAGLRARVEEAGIATVQRSVREVLDRGDHLVVDGEPTRYLVAADGLHSPVRRMSGLDGVPARRRRFGLRCHVDVEPWSSFVEVHWAPAGEAYVTPVGDGQVGVAVLSAQRRSFDDLIGDFPRLAERLAGLTLSRVRGAGPLHQRSRSRVAGRVLLVGDAAGYVDALTGEGIGLGLAQARSAVGAVAADRPGDYPAHWRRIMWRHDVLTRALVGATDIPLVRRRVVGAAAALPMVFGAAVDQLARPA